MKFPVCDVLLAFKNGKAVVERSLTFKKNTTKMTTVMPSTSIHGTFWLACDGVKIKCSKSVESEVVCDEKKACTTLSELMEANVGQDVFIDDEVETVCVKQVLKGSGHGSSVSIVVLEEKDGKMRYVPMERIKVIKGKEGSQFVTSIEKREVKREVEIHYEAPKEDTVGKMYYVMNNFTWSPSYRMHLQTEENTAVLRMQAAILNDAENIFVKKFVCAAGAPRMKFQGVDDPFVSGNTITQFFSQTAGGGRRGSYPVPQMQNRLNILSNVAMPQQQQRYSQAPPGSSSGGGSEGGGSNATDYYYYEFDDVSVEKRQRIVLPVFALKMPFEEMYKVTLRKQQNANDPLKVTHCVKVVNKSDFIWTTGPCTITSDKQLFAGQDQICYTAKTVHALVEIADALSINVKMEEDVKVNKKKKSRVYGTDYFQAEVVNKVEVTNFQDKKIRILCDYSFIGSLCKTSVKHSQLRTELNTSAESHTRTIIEWEIDVKGNKSTKFEFTYNKWVRDRHY